MPVAWNICNTKFVNAQWQSNETHEHRGKITKTVLWSDINVWLLPKLQLVGNKYKIIFYNGSIFLI
jgi:hypothetical protein